MRFPRVLLPVAVLLAGAFPATAQGTLSEGDFLQAFGESHPAVRALGEDLARAEGARVRAGALRNPEAQLWREQPEASPRLTNWTLGWSPPLDGRFGLAKQAAEAGLGSARAGLAAARLGLRRDLRRAYAEWALSSERAQALRSQLAIVGTLEENARARAQSGEQSGLAAGRIRLAAQEVRTALGLAEAEVIQAQARARGWRDEIPRGVQPVRPPLPPAPSERPPLTRPDVESLRLEVRRAALESRMARRFVSFPVLEAGWQRLEERGAVQGGWILGLRWSVPLFDRAQGTRREAALRQDALAARVAVATSRAEAEAEAALSAYRQLSQAAAEARQAVEGTDRLVEGATAAFRAGETGVTDVLETLRAVREARLRAIEVYAAALEAHRNLEVAIGRPLAEAGSR